jgi:transcriptional regulator with XRE-family HTH domain
MKSVDPNDAMVGASIRLHRLAAEMSQTELGAKLGLTFQQIQKYEKGTNRVGAGRLLTIAGILKVPVTAFYGEGKKPSASGHSPLHLLDKRDAYKLAEAFDKITNPRLRQTLVALVQNLSEP